MSKVCCFMLSVLLLVNSFTGIGIALQSRLSVFIVASPDFQSDVQPRAIRVLSLPEYYPEYRETGEGYAGFLGASITAKASGVFYFGARH